MSDAAQEESTNRPGPKGVYDRALIPRIAELAELGMPQTLIAQGLGIKPETFSRWMTKHQELAEAVKEARLAGAEARLKKISQAIDKNGNAVWQANAWILQRMFPGEFAQPETKVQVHNDVTVTVVTSEQLKAIQARKLAAMQAHGRN